MGRAEEQLGADEALFRDVNETVAQAAEQRDPAEPVEFLCECADTFCAESVILTREQYEQVRAGPHHFAVKPGHFLPQIEHIVERQRGYWVIEKLGDAGEVAEERDPRS